MSSPQFHGTIYLSTRMYTEKQFGPAAVGQVLAQLSPADRQVLGDVTSVGWYPVAPVLAFHREVDRQFGSGDFELCVQVGRFSAGWALNTALKLFLKLKNPHWLTERSGSLWNRYHNSGRWEYEPPQPNRICARLHDFAVRDEAFCARLRGWLAGAIELTGGRNANVTERCVAGRGDKQHHEFLALWE